MRLDKTTSYAVLTLGVLFATPLFAQAPRGAALSVHLQCAGGRLPPPARFSADGRHAQRIREAQAYGDRRLAHDRKKRGIAGDFAGQRRGPSGERAFQTVYRAGAGVHSSSHAP